MYKISTIFILLFSSTYGFSQAITNTAARGANLIIGAEPLYGFINCFKTNLEYKPIKHNFGVELTPEIYMGEHAFNFTQDEVSGFGIGLYFQKYLTPATKLPAIISLGATYRNINVSYSERGFIPEQETGLTYYHYKDFNDVVKAQNLLVNVKFSIKAVNHLFYLEPYTGVGYKFGSTSATYPGYRTENKTMLDYGYRGFTWLIGLKMGFNYRTGK